jgi:hypothetical protein
VFDAGEFSGHPASLGASGLANFAAEFGARQSGRLCANLPAQFGALEYHQHLMNFKIISFISGISPHIESFFRFPKVLIILKNLRL